MKYYKNKKILIAGGSGLVGTNLLIELLKYNKKNVVASYNHSIKEKKLKRFYKKYNFLKLKDCIEATKNKNIVFILAVKQSGIFNLENNYEDNLIDNFKLRLNILKSCKINKVRKIVWVSSSTVYQPYNKKIKEEDLDLNKDPYDIYLGTGWLYRYLEKLFFFYIHKYKMDISIIRTAAIYGKYDNFDNKKSHVVPALIKKSLSKNRYLDVWGDPNIVRDFVFAEDLAKAILLITPKKNIQLVNFSSGKSLSIKNLASKILKISNTKKILRFINKSKSSAKFRVLNNKKFDKYFPSFKRTSIATGIKETIDWYKQK